VTIFLTKMITEYVNRRVQSTVLEGVTGTVTRKPTSEFPF